jgi:hypothetical protein
VSYSLPVLKNNNSFISLISFYFGRILSKGITTSFVDA